MGSRRVDRPTSCGRPSAISCGAGIGRARAPRTPITAGRTRRWSCSTASANGSRPGSGCDRGRRAMIGGLTAGDRADLEASGLREATILLAHLRSVSRQEASDHLRYGVPSGDLAFPYPTLNGGRPFCRIKLHRPGGDGKRYRSPRAQGNRLYFTPGIDWARVVADPTTPIIIAEGEKKCLA